MKRVVHVYKRAYESTSMPPGIGDFLRGTCHLFELAQEKKIDLRVDVSGTEFAHLIERDDDLFQYSELNQIDAAEEYFNNEPLLHQRVEDFIHSNQEQLFICTNLGWWNRTFLPVETRAFASRFFKFVPEIQQQNELELGHAPYAVLSVRCGDQFFGSANAQPDIEVRKILFDVIEKRILRKARFPIIVMSDSLQMKRELGHRYGMQYLDTVAQHGAFGNALPVVRDLDLLKRSKFNYHINMWQGWWSGFSHYTSLIFQIPEMNLMPRRKRRRWWRPWIAYRC